MKIKSKKAIISGNRLCALVLYAYFTPSRLRHSIILNANSKEIMTHHPLPTSFMPYPGATSYIHLAAVVVQAVRYSSPDLKLLAHLQVPDMHYIGHCNHPFGSVEYPREVAVHC